MPGNRSLDEFAPDGTSEGEPEPQPNPEPDADGPTVEPKPETFAWSADGRPCTRCGESVETHWRDGDDLVCAGCKTW